MHRTLFPTNLKEMEWLEFPAEGFAANACGLVHRTSTPASYGMPLGGVGTGCLDLETDGTLGFCTIFNSFVPRRGPLNVPFLGLGVKNERLPYGYNTWVLSTRKLRGEDLRVNIHDCNAVRGAPASEIHYWGHYPVADLEFEMDAPVGVGLRAWAPFIPGDTAVSNTPAAVFEARLRNLTDRKQECVLVFSFPGPSPQESGGAGGFEHLPLGRASGTFSGVLVTNGRGVEYALGIAHTDAVKEFRTGGDLGCDGGYWSTFGQSAPWFNPFPGLPQVAGQPGASAMAALSLEPGEEQTVPFVLAWYCPAWKGGGGAPYGGQTYFHKYAERYQGAAEIARMVAARRGELLRRILAWQALLYGERTLPVWLRDSLVNILHLITEDGFWAQARPPIGEWCRKEDGLFGFSECPRMCPQIECIPCSFYGNLPLVYFFPELARSTLRAYKAYQYPEGNAPWVFGGCTVGSPPCELALPSRGYAHKPQTTLDGPCYVDMIERLWLRTGDRGVLDEFYASMKRNTVFTVNLRPGSGPAGIVSMPADNNGQDWIESCDLFGIVPHIGGVHLANLRMAARMARETGDAEFERQCEAWFRQGSEALESKTWLGDCYMLYNEEETGKTSDVVMGCQLDGEWMARSHGLEGVFRPERVARTLETLKTTNVYAHGAIVFRMRKEGEFVPGYWGKAGVHVPSSLMLAMVYLYGGQRDFGLELARRTMHALAIVNRCSWDSILLYRGDTAELMYGPDYYQNLMLWAMPAAVAGTDLAAPCRKGGLVDRMIAAGRE